MRQPSVPDIRVPLLLQEPGFSDIRSERPERILLLYHFSPSGSGISTAREIVAYLQSLSRFSIVAVNVQCPRDENFLALDPSIDLDAFAAIVIHNTVAYDLENLQVIDRYSRRKLSDYKGAKVLMKQDENFLFRELSTYIGEVGFDLIFTCLPRPEIDKVYPPSIVGAPKFIQMLTGYVTPHLRAIKPFSSHRPIDIGYRGSIQPLSFGWLAYEKRKIGEDIARRLKDGGLKLDITSRWEDRFIGQEWLDFLHLCKATLGAESGASVWDIKGDLTVRCEQAEQKLGPFRMDEAYAEEYLGYLSDLENVIDYAQISPRHFEAAATGTLQLLYPGKYSNIFQPQRHFFPLARDYSNLNDAVEAVKDEQYRKRITEAAYEEIILDQSNWIEAFIAQFDDAVEKALESRNLLVTPHVESSSESLNVLMLVSSEPHRDPRLRWTTEGSPPDIVIHHLGVRSPDSDGELMTISQRGSIEAASPRKSRPEHAAEHWQALLSHSAAGMAAALQLQAFEQMLQLSEDRLRDLIGAPSGTERIHGFRWGLMYFLDTAVTLIESASRYRGVHAIIACDLDTLLPALILKGLWGVPVFYDAHEYWPEADIAALEFEIQYWRDIEGRLLTYTDYRQTVSSPLARLMSERYGLAFQNVPNCELSTQAQTPRKSDTTHTAQCQFLYTGGFAPGRGIERLVKIWPQTTPEAILLLQGPENEYKGKIRLMAEQTGLLGSKILFPTAVREDEIISTAHEADVGLIPYEPIGINNTNCCPNKTSQYMAAGLPIIANTTNFVKDIISEAKCGRTVNFADEKQFVQIINEFARNKALREEYGIAGNKFFRVTFNWENLSKPLYQALRRSIEAPPKRLRLYEERGVPGWTQCRQPKHVELVFTRPFQEGSILAFIFGFLKKTLGALPKPLKDRLRHQISRVIQRLIYVPGEK